MHLSLKEACFISKHFRSAIIKDTLQGAFKYGFNSLERFVCTKCDVRYYFSLESSTICSASEKLRTWSALGRGWTGGEKKMVQIRGMSQGFKGGFVF